MSARDLQKMEIPPINWAVTDLIPEGLTLLAGRPKAGKSFIVLDLALSITNEHKFLGKFNCVPGKVLFIPYEDNTRRLQSRINDLMDGVEAPEGLLFPNELYFPKLDRGGVENIRSIIKDDPDIKMVVIDTFGTAISSGFNSFGTSFKEDYEFLSHLQHLSMEYRLSIVLIHHTRKMLSDNVFDEIVGTTGVTASPDTLMLIRKSGSKTLLHITGRDVEEENFEISFDQATFKWELIAEGVSYASTAERQTIIDGFEGDYDKELQIKEIADKTGKTRLATSQLIRKMKLSGEITEGSGYGIYKLPSPN